MTFLIWLGLAIPAGFIAGAVVMGLWLTLKPLAIGGIRAIWRHKSRQ